MQHLDEGTIHAWLDGALPPDEAAGVERHAAACTRCAEQIAEARGLIAAASGIVSSLDVVRGGVLPAARDRARQRSLWRALRLTPVRAALAATVLVAAGSLLAVRHTQIDISQQLVQNAHNLPRRPAAAATRPPSAVSVPAAAPAAPVSKRHPTVVAANTAPVRDSARTARAVVAETAPVAAAAAPKAEPAPANAAPSVAVDSVDAARRAAAHAATPARRLPAFGQSSLKLQEVVVTGLAEAHGMEGCFELRGERTARDAGLPERFALERPNIVRFVNPDSGRDSIIPGASWRQTGPTAARVTFPLPNGAPTTVEFNTQTLSTRFADVSKPTVRVVRADCKP